MMIEPARRQYDNNGTRLEENTFIDEIEAECDVAQNKETFTLNSVKHSPRESPYLLYSI